MISSQKGPNRHAYAWQIGPFWQDTLDMYHHFDDLVDCSNSHALAMELLYASISLKK